MLTAYEHSLSALFIILFLASIIAHAISGAKDYSDEEFVHGGEPVTTLQYIGTSQFWFETFQISTRAPASRIDAPRRWSRRRAHTPPRACARWPLAQTVLQ
jgi:hypothetical protein